MVGGAVMAGGCVTPLPKPTELIAPEPRHDNCGQFMCPYTTDGVLAKWVDKAINAKLGATVGQHVGAFLGNQAVKQVPLVGGFLGSMVGETVGREIAIRGSGGWDYIKCTSDQSFDGVDDMAIYLYVKHSTHAHYRGAVDATGEIYPALMKRYVAAIQAAPRRQ